MGDALSVPFIVDLLVVAVILTVVNSENEFNMKSRLRVETK